MNFYPLQITSLQNIISEGQIMKLNQSLYKNKMIFQIKWEDSTKSTI